jgi:hypothetical protein
MLTLDSEVKRNAERFPEILYFNYRQMKQKQWYRKMRYLK